MPKEHNMKKYRVYFAVTVLVLVSLACKALSQFNEQPSLDDNTTPPAVDTTMAPVPTSDSSTDDTNSNSNENSNTDVTVSTDFPMTDDAFNVTEMGEAGLLYYTQLSLDDLMKFYRDEYTAKGYTERELLTVVASGTFSMVFDGDPSGKAVVIQSVDLGDGSRTVSIRLEDI
jgi:hypothetical protein